MTNIGWLVGCIVLDIGVILTNLCEQIYILRGWSSLDRIDHLLLSLSISDLVNGVATLSIDSWFLARDFVLSNNTSMSARGNHSISTNHSITANQSMAANHSILTNKIATNVLVKHHKVVKHILDTVFLFTVFASVLHVTAVAIERIYAVRFPRKYYIFTKFKTKCITISLIWIISLILTPSFLLLRTDSIKARLIRGNALAVIVITVFAIYACVAYFLFQQHKSVLDTFSDSSLQVDRLRRLTIMCIFIGISFVACIAPMTLGFFYEPFSHEVSSVMVTLNSIINPCIYFAKVYQDGRYTKKPDTGKELIPKRAYGYTLTTIVDENECKEQYRNNGSPKPRVASPISRMESSLPRDESPLTHKLLT